MAGKRHLLKSVAGAMLFSVPIMAAAEQAVFSVDVLDTLILIEPRVDDLKVAELSGLAFDERSGKLFAISDRSRLFAFDLDLTDDRLTILEPVSGRDLVDAEGAEMRDLGFDGEDIAILEGDVLAIVSEVGPRISTFSQLGVWTGDRTVPEALVDPAAQRSENDGLESLTFHPVLGQLTAPEEPLEAQPRAIHTIYGEDGRTLAFDTSDIGTTSIKAMETMPDGRLMILERDVAEDDSLITFLRLLDPATCPTDGLCETEVQQVVIPGISDADFEGLTRVGEDLFLVVSDDKIGRDDRSVFALMRVTAPTAQ